MPSVHHVGRKERDRIKRLSLKGGARSVDDLALIAKYPEVAMAAGFQDWQVREAMLATRILNERGTQNGS